MIPLQAASCRAAGEEAPLRHTILGRHLKVLIVLLCLSASTDVSTAAATNVHQDSSRIEMVQADSLQTKCFLGKGNKASQAVADVARRRLEVGYQVSVGAANIK